MRQVNVKTIQNAIREMCISANYNIGEDVLSSFIISKEKEESPIGKDILGKLIENAELARENKVPICQDTGMTVVFIELGQEVALIGGDINEAVNEGVSQGYMEGYLRKSVVEDPFIRKNTGDNTPAIIYYDIVPGDRVKIIVTPKGFGSENMSRIKMLKPSDGVEGVEEFVVDTVSKAGPNPCPPIIVGVGIGGTMDKAAYLAKKALIRPIGNPSTLEHIRDIENRLFKKINNLGIGPQGLGGRITTLGVNIEVFATHIAGLPVAVNINCHASRHEERII